MKPKILDLTLVDHVSESGRFTTWKRAKVILNGQEISVQDVKVEITSEGLPIATLKVPVRLQHVTTTSPEESCKGCNGDRTVLRAHGAFGEYVSCGECGGTGRG